MGVRGRRSAASLTTIGPSGIESTQRPEPVAELTDEQAAVWVSVVNRLPADWFPRETLPMLAHYCRHVVAARRIAQLIERLESADEIDLNEYDRLLRMQDREGRAMSSMATRMRITQQASYDRKKSKGVTLTENPWDN